MDSNTISTCEIIWFTPVSPNHETHSNMDVFHHTMSYCDTKSHDLGFYAEIIEHYNKMSLNP